MTFADFHCDTLDKILDNNQSLLKNNGQLDIMRLLNNAQNAISIQAFACWIDSNNPQPFIRCNQLLDKFYQQYDTNKDYINLWTGGDFAPSKVNAILTIENGSALMGKLQNVEYFYNRGIRLITLTWNGTNELGSGNVGGNGSGLTNFGIDVVKACSSLGILVDVSHLSDNGFTDVARTLNNGEAFVASHSNARAITNHPRNLTNDQIDQIIARNGFIGINLYPQFLGDSTDDILRHCDYILSRGGEDVLGFGTDFDGIEQMPKGINGVEDMPKVYRLLSNEFGAKIADKIIGDNLKRVIKESI
ncbi:MAG: membrane dipeptidase [Clostridiales bacterium]|jgi:membrane dipeptidase|nr:membrane dipeptidase [Clostridiales bacterium]